MTKHLKPVTDDHSKIPEKHRAKAQLLLDPLLVEVAQRVYEFNLREAEVRINTPEGGIVTINMQMEFPDD